MYIVKVLKRKDAASVVVAVVLALLLLQVLSTITNDLAMYLSGVEGGGVMSWRMAYVHPVISFVLQVILLEAFLRAVVYVRPYFVGRVKK